MKTINNNKVVLVTVALMGATLFAGGAQADAGPVDAVTRTVHFEDLNLNTDAGAKVLYHRIQSAAKQVCGDPMARQLEAAAAAKACIDKAIVASVRTVNKESLTRTANAHGYAVEANINVASR